jgi:hypothetical protein
MASRGGVLVREGLTLARAASFAFAMCSRNAFEELSVFGDGCTDLSVLSACRPAFAFAICSRRAMDELDTFRLVTGVFFTSVSRLGDGVMEAVTLAPEGDMA